MVNDDGRLLSVVMSIQFGIPSRPNLLPPMFYVSPFWRFFSEKRPKFTNWRHKIASSEIVQRNSTQLKLFQRSILFGPRFKINTKKSIRPFFEINGNFDVNKNVIHSKSVFFFYQVIVLHILWRILHWRLLSWKFCSLWKKTIQLRIFFYRISKTSL